MKFKTHTHTPLFEAARGIHSLQHTAERFARKRAFKKTGLSTGTPTDEDDCRDYTLHQHPTLSPTHLTAAITQRMEEKNNSILATPPPLLSGGSRPRMPLVWVSDYIQQFRTSPPVKGSRDALSMTVFVTPRGQAKPPFINTFMVKPMIS
ncbi:hypothetical protein B0F90DRAFT_908062 [Multifurca ochricompacta]|uniref:Uncharacterized protein n=1 Tax=Multifurca ochricompacta TaxID=376703 RepID=A0AAD4LW42_9AGAM|nr:hypothetical protein B0F90DRAFT_908062 [Multifurca ochricompacta]